MATITSLVPDVQPMIADPVPEAKIESAILWSAREFLRKSRWLRETITEDIVDGVNSYALTPATTDAEVFALQAAEHSTLGYLTPATQEEVSSGTEGWFFFVPPNYIQLSHTPDANITDGLLVRVVLSLTTSATTIPDSVLAQWNAAISYGAIARLLSMKKSPWSDPAGAEEYRQMYREDLIMARYEAEQQSKAYAYGVVQG